MSRTERVLQVAATVWLVLLLVSCGAAAPAPTAVPTPTAVLPTPTPVPPTVAPTPGEEWTVYELPRGGYAISLPPHWEQIDMDPQTLESSLDAFAERNPEMATLLSGRLRSLVTAGISFFGFDLSVEAAASGFATNINILTQTLGAEVSLDFYAQLNVGQLENMDIVVKPITHSRVRLEAGDAEKVEYSWSMTSVGNETVQLAVAQYLLVRGKTAYILTMTTTADQAAKYKPLFEQIAGSFRIIE